MHFNGRWLVYAVLIVSVLAVFPSPSLAAPITGSLNIAGLDDAQVSALFLTFLCAVGPPAPTSPCPANYGNFQATGGTGSFVPYSTDKGFIHSLSNASQPLNTPFLLPNFLIFDPVAPFGTVLPPDIALDMTFIFLGTQSAAACFAAPAPGQNCTPILPALVGPNNPTGVSAFNLQNTQTGSTASFSMAGLARRISTGELSDFTGVFTAQFNVPYQSYLPTIASGGTVQNSYSATFNATIIPEPETSQLLLSGGLLLLISGVARRYRRKTARV